MESDIGKSDISLPEDLLSEIPLPDELLSEIISKFIPLCQWSRCLENVSKQFQRCSFIAYGRMKSISCRKLFSLLYIYDYRSENCAVIRLNAILEKLSAVCPNLADIVDFDFVASNMHSSNSWDILAQFDRLQSISFANIKKIVFQPFADFVAGSKSLKHLSIIKCSFDSGGNLDVGTLSNVAFRLHWESPAKICLENLSENLIVLTLGNFADMFENPCDAMKNCRNLEWFSITLLTMKDYEIFLSNLPYLRKLTRLCVVVSPYNPLQSSGFNMQFCEQLNFLKNQLQCIKLKGTAVMEEVQCFLLSEFLQLQTLRFHFCKLSANAAKNLQRLSALKKFWYLDVEKQSLPVALSSLIKLENFTDLALSGNLVCHWKEFENICYLVNLQNLRLDGTSVTDELLQAWDKKNPEMFEKLVSFQIWYARSISDAGAMLVVKKARNLKTLELGSSGISEKTISVLAEVAKKLTNVELQQDEEPFLFDENDVIGLIKKAICLKKVKVSNPMVYKIREHKSFLPFVENVDIDFSHFI